MATVSTSGGNWLILPKQLSIINLPLSIHSAQLRVRYGYDLIQGLGYLHEHGIAHLDIKPRNLVYTMNGPLQIIDFDAAVRVESEDTEIEGICGTQGWRAPEIGNNEDEVAPPRFSPILADRWSCGSVLLWLVADAGREGAVLLEIATLLLDMEPHCRLSLVGLDRWSCGSVGLYVRVRANGHRHFSRSKRGNYPKSNEPGLHLATANVH